MLTQKEQEEILEGCRQNNRKAQEGLYRAYYKAMVTVCLRYTKNENDAVEVLNTSFLKVFQNIKTYEAVKGSLYAWMRTIIVYNCLDFVKKKNRNEKQSELDAAADVHVSPDAISKIKAAELLALIRSLPPATAAVFNLYVIEGYGHKEIATLLTISEGTSKWHLSEARKTLQQKIKTQDINS